MPAWSLSTSLRCLPSACYIVDANRIAENVALEAVIDRVIGHYRIGSAAGLEFPGGWRGEQFLDYGIAGNHWYDPAALGYCPLVAVNEGDNDLLIGWEIFKLGPVLLPLPDFWALKREGPLDEVVPVPRP